MVKKLSLPFDLNFKEKIRNFEFKRFINNLFPAFFAIALLIIAVPIMTYAYFARDLSTKESIMNRNDSGLTILDRDGKPFFTFYQAKQKEEIPLSEIPQDFQEAIIAIEDQEFYNHPGFSIRGILRAFIANLTQKELAQGGSTITQQLVKNALLQPEKSFLRKYQEIVLAEEIERRYSKKEILEMYLNSVYFGEGAFGIESAAQTYFDKSAKELSLPEAAMLAGLLPAPSVYSPISGDKQMAKNRQRLVLQNMLEEGYITADEKAKAEKATLMYAFKQDDLNTTAPHFALYVREQLIQKYGEEKVIRSGFKVKTTLNLRWQQYAEQVVKQQVTALENNKATNGAVVVIDPHTGEILVMVGSKDWFDKKDGTVNMAVLPRQPGSSFKPIVYAKAIEQKTITAASILSDRPTTFPGNYRPLNYDKKFRGQVTVRRALATSLNIPAVETLNKIGVPSAIEMGQRLGITTFGDTSNYGLSLVLGTAEIPLLEMTSAYAVFASEGEKYPPTTILEVSDKSEKILQQYRPVPEYVMKPEITFLMSSILSDNRARAEAFGNALTISRPAAVKTGTTDEYKDAWTIGYTPSLVVGVWVGNNDHSPMDQVAGSLGAAPIWRSLMEEYHRGSPIADFRPPSGVTRLAVCQNGKEATNSAGLEYFIPGTQPSGICRELTPTPTGNSPTPENGNNEDEERRKREEEEKKRREEEEKNRQNPTATPQPPTATPVPTALPLPTVEPTKKS